MFVLSELRTFFFFLDSYILRQCFVEEFRGTKGIRSPNIDVVNLIVQQLEYIWQLKYQLEKVTHVECVESGALWLVDVHSVVPPGQVLRPGEETKQDYK